MSWRIAPRPAVGVKKKKPWLNILPLQNPRLILAKYLSTYILGALSTYSWCSNFDNQSESLIWSISGEKVGELTLVEYSRSGVVWIRNFLVADFRVL